jgi:hypothetical protein
LVERNENGAGHLTTLLDPNPRPKEISMLRSFRSLFSFPGKRKSANRAAHASKRSRTFRPGLEGLETRLVPSSVPLHVVGNQLKDPANNPVVLRGVNVASLEWRPDGYNVKDAVNIYLNDWHANLLRLPVNQDYWFGHNEAWGQGEAGDGGDAYRSLVKEVIDSARAHNAYVVLDLHWSNMGTSGANNDQHYLPDDNSTEFWKSAAAIYANDPAVLFDPYNEPHFASDQPTDADFAKWQNGGMVTEDYYKDNQFIGTFTYHSPGMQGLIDTIRATGATNVLVPEGLNWGSNLYGVLNGHALNDPTGNLMYQSHLYQGKIEDPQVAESVETLGKSYPIYVGEWGEGGVLGAPNDTAAGFNQQRLAYLDNHPNFSWTAWAMPILPGNEYNLLTEWNANSTTSDFGVYVKANLAAHANGTPPTVVNAAQTSANPVAGTTTNLSVLGGDAAGEAGLTYTWTTLNAPAAVTFSANGSNAAKNVTVTFTSAGTYVFQALIQNASGLTTTSQVTVTVSQTMTSLVVSPGSPNVNPGASQQFTAQARDQFGNALNVQPAFTWSLASGDGSINAAGLYQAPAAPGTAVVKAVSGGISGTATVTISASPKVAVAFADVDDWGTGFTGYVTLTNTTNSAINGWTVEFDFAGPIWDIWDAQIVSHVGNHYVVKNADWDATIAAGQSVSFGFNADWVNPPIAPSNFVVNVGPSLSATANFADVNDWGIGFTGYVSLTNTGNTPINGWTLEFDFTGSIWDIWDAQIVSHVGNHYVVKNADWDAVIAAGQSVSFGFNADWGLFPTGPSNFVLNGVSIKG